MLFRSDHRQRSGRQRACHLHIARCVRAVLTIVVIQFLGENLISWSSKRQSTIALSTTEVEYIAAAGCSTQMLWMKSQLEDFQIFESNIPIFCDNTSAICLSENPILHSRAKHIEIKHHFIREYVHTGILSLNFIDTDHQWDDIFTKPLAEDRFFILF